MECKRPEKGDVYRHFKGNRYEILTIAKHTETMEEMVIYKELEGEQVYARPLEMFISKVDRNKYPDISQEYRFQLQKQNEEFSIMEFLDLETVSQKIRYLELKKECITENLLEIIAHSHDFVENEGSLELRYHALLNYFRTLEKYEKRR